MIHLGLLGSSGRMGREIQTLLETEFSEHFSLNAAVDQGDSKDSLSRCDVIIDFSSPQAVLEWISLSHTTPALIVGSTGWNEEQQKKLAKFAQKAVVLQASNFSMGVFALKQGVKQANHILKGLGYTFKIHEAHHQHKKDSPSGTAVSLQKILSPENPGSIPTESVRSGEIIGDHTVTFEGPSDRLQLFHHAKERSIFARGALEAARRILEKQPGKILSLEDLYLEEKK